MIMNMAGGGAPADYVLIEVQTTVAGKIVFPGVPFEPSRYLVADMDPMARKSSNYCLYIKNSEYHKSWNMAASSESGQLNANNYAVTYDATTKTMTTGANGSASTWVGIFWK